jgi:hypothetical protein
MRTLAMPVLVATGIENARGRLVMGDDVLVAVLVELSDVYGDLAGQWFLETGFGSLSGQGHPIFADLDAAMRWIEDHFSEWTSPPVRPAKMA